MIEFEIQLLLGLGLFFNVFLFGVAMNEIDKLKATIKKDREQIADYLNELTKKANEQ
jgi:hypothetical protein